jgi:hypothetical protein
MFSNIFGGGRRAASPKRQSKEDLLRAAEQTMRQLRAMQPSDPEAFPVLNECSRLGKGGM